MRKKRGGCHRDGYCYIRVLAPQENESLTVDSEYSIQWESVNVTSVEIKYSIDGGENWTSIKKNISSKDSKVNSYQWIVPKVQPGNCLIEIIAENRKCEGTSGRSGIFKISKKKNVTVQ